MVNPASDRPVFQQIADILRGQILAGTYGEGDRLPSESDLMATHSVGRDTARRALKTLGEQGLVDAKRGVGVFVRARPAVRRVGWERYAGSRNQPKGETPFTRDAGPKARVEATFTEEEPSIAVRERLRLANGDWVQARRFRFYQGAEMVQMSTSYVPLDLVRGTPVADEANEPWPGGTIGQMASLGVRITEVTEDIACRPPSPEEIAALRLRPGVGVLTIERTMWAGDRPMETADIVMHGERFKVSTRIPVD